MRSKYLHGMHEPGGERLMADKPGWIVFTHGIGRDPKDVTGCDYRSWADKGFGIISRLNHGYGKSGTVPQPQYYDAFSWRVANFVQTSKGCETWIIGNEPNHSQERPDGQPILTADYARCYRMCADRALNVSGHAADQVCTAAISPWNTETGDWLAYFEEVLLAARPNAIALHTYTHGTDPALVTSEAKMEPPFQNRRFHFRAYRDFLARIPDGMAGLPIYVTETDQTSPWDDRDSGWVQAAYEEVANWNRVSLSRRINALCLYRWPRYDQWYIEGKGGMHADFQKAVARGYPSGGQAEWEASRTWTESEIRAIVRDEVAR